MVRLSGGARKNQQSGNENEEFVRHNSLLSVLGKPLVV